MITPKFHQSAKDYDNTTPIQTEVARVLWQKIYQSQHDCPNAPLIWLDVGCGTGKLSQQLLYNYANSQNNSFKLLALDQSPAMLKQFAQSQIFQQFSSQIELIAADMTAIPLANHSVNRVMSSFAVHWASPIVLAELVRATQPAFSQKGAQIHLAIPVAGSLGEVASRFPQLPIFPFLPADAWLNEVEKIIQSRCGHWLYNEQRSFRHGYANLATLLQALKKMGGAVSGQPAMPAMVLKRYLADSQPIDLDYEVLLVGFEI